MKQISLSEMIMLAADQLLNNPEEKITFYYKDAMSRMHEIQQMDLLKEYFVTSNGDIPFYNDSATRSSLFVKLDSGGMLD